MTAQHTYPQSFDPDYDILPGDILDEVLAERGMSQADLARRTGLSTKHVNQVVGGTAPVSPEAALKLERATGISARVWVNLEANHQVFALRKDEEERVGLDLEWLDAFPTKDLIKRGHLDVDPAAPPVDRLRALLTFFGVADRAAWQKVWEVKTAYRKSRAFESDPQALFAWLRVGERQAAETSCPPFDRGLFRQLLRRIRALTRLGDPNEWSALLEEWCREAGVVVVFEPELPKARIVGAVRWVSTDGQRDDKALLQFSLRHSWADIFWFTFFHEAGHLLLHDRKRLTVMDDKEEDNLTFIEAGGVANALEREADEFASRLLIPREHELQLGNLRTAQDIERFAYELGIGPGIVVGRLQHDGILQYNQFNQLRKRFKFRNRF